VKGPEPYLRQLRIELPCAVNATQAAIIDPAHRRFVDEEIYYVGSDSAVVAFDAYPERYTGFLTDPVSLERFQPGPASPRRNRPERLLIFESQETARVYDTSPDTLRIPRPMMRRR
jgi:hypothetical protein